MAFQATAASAAAPTCLDQALVATGPAAARPNGDGTSSFVLTATGTVTVSIPAGASSVRFDVCGAQGASTDDAQGGEGGRVEGTVQLPASASRDFVIVVGSSDGKSGGGGAAGHPGDQNRSDSANGGGLSGVFRSAVTRDTALLVAGGGGGAAAGGSGAAADDEPGRNGGAGSGATGEPGAGTSSQTDGGGGGGAPPGLGGAGASGVPLAVPAGSNGEAGKPLAGGAGGNGNTALTGLALSFGPPGGGGGGGYLGGGGGGGGATELGAGGGGGGGSGFVDTAAVTSSNASTGGRRANGAVVVTFDPQAPVLSDIAIDPDPATTTVTVSGTVTDSSTATVTVTLTDADGSPVKTATAVHLGGSEQAFSVPFDLAGFDDGVLLATAVARDAFGGMSQTQSDTAEKDAIGPVVSGVLAEPDPVTSETQDAVRVTADVTEASTATVTITISDSAGARQSRTVVMAPGDGAVDEELDVTSLQDGPLTATVTATSPSGASDSGSDTVEKDAVGPGVSDVTIAPDPVTPQNASRVTVSGIVTEASTATVTITITSSGGGDSRTRTIVLAPAEDGFSEVFDLSGLGDGTLTANVVARSPSGASGSGSDTATKTSTGPGASDTTAPVVTGTTVSPDPITSANQSRVSVSGTVSETATVTISLSSSGGSGAVTRTIVLPAPGDFNETFDVTSLADGTITAVVRATDGAGNTGTGTDTASKSTAAAGGGGSGGGTAPVGTSPTASPTASASATPSASPRPATAAGRFHAITPARVLDTREAPNVRVSAGNDRAVQITGRGGIPSSGVSAVVLNVTVTGASARGDLQLYPTGQRPQNRTSNLNFFAGETVPVQVQTGVSSDGRVSLSLNTGSADVVIDVFGYYGDANDTVSGSSGYTALQPARLLDTRTTGQRVRVDEDRTVRVAGLVGVPADATAVVFNTTVLGTPANADLQVYPTGDRPAERTSNLNVRRGQTKANSVIAALGRDGSVDLSLSNGNGHVVLDVLGYYSPRSTGRFIALTPSRIFDTRDDRSPLRAGQDRVVRVGGRGGVPAGAQAAVLSVTGTGASNPVDLQVFPTGDRPVRRTSTINFRPGEAVANVAIATLGTDDAVTLSLSQGSATVILDVVGYMTSQ